MNNQTLAKETLAPTIPWYKELNGYHWLVFTICTLGWTFDCMDQQLFTFARASAMAELMSMESTSDTTIRYATLATSIMLIGWATGGIIFGILGDKFGRVKIMFFTILAYSLLTGLNAFAVSIWDFMIIRFLAGIGIGGQFAVGTALLAETMPQRARPYALGIMQVVAGFGNVSAALIAMTFNEMFAAGMITWSPWRCVFLFGSIPAVLAYFVARYLREPESWLVSVRAGRDKVGSLRELFGNPMLRKHVVLGMILAATGVIGGWGIGMFSMELAGKIGARIALETREYQQIEADALARHNVARETTDEIPLEIRAEIEAEQLKILRRAADKWRTRNLLIYNFGAIAGLFSFTIAAVYWGRRISFTVFMSGCILFTVTTFLFFNSLLTQWTLVPLMGFFIISLSGGYTIYFPELFPTRLRSTGVSFCYNVGRYLAACGPLALGGLTAFFAGHATAEDSTLPLRYAGVTMCSVFIIGITTVWFLPETKGKPLPE